MRDLCEKQGSSLIFDEVITGFRVAYGGAQQLYGIVPDLTCLGKIIGGGFPIGAFGGRREIMEHLAPLGGVYQAGTLSGNPIAVRAGIHTLRRLKEEDPYGRLRQRLWGARKERRGDSPRPGHTLPDKRALPPCSPGFSAAQEVVDYESAFSSDRRLYELFFKSMLEEGLFFAPSQFEAAFLTMAFDDAIMEQTDRSLPPGLQKDEERYLEHFLRRFGALVGPLNCAMCLMFDRESRRIESNLRVQESRECLTGSGPDSLRTWALIDLGRSGSKLSVHRGPRLRGTALLCVIKADAYGHGAVEVGRRLESMGVRHFGVATIDEGRKLRINGMSSPILVLSGVMPWESVASAVDHNLTPVIINFEMLDRIAAFRGRRPVKVHVKIDTGMGRLGFAPREIEALARKTAGIRAAWKSKAL